MTVAEMIEQLEKVKNKNKQIMILDGFNGGGVPREINLFSNNHKVSKDDANQTSDCEGLVGRNVLVLGYGCY